MLSTRNHPCVYQKPIKKANSRACWQTPVILATWKMEVGPLQIRRVTEMNIAFDELSVVEERTYQLKIVQGETSKTTIPPNMLQVIYPKELKIHHTKMHMNVYCSFIQNFQNLQITKMSIKRYMNKLWYITKHRKIFKGKSKRAIQS